MTGTLQQIIPGKVPEGDLAICYIPGTCIINLQNPFIGIILETMLFHQMGPQLKLPVDVTSQSMSFQCNKIKSYLFCFGFS